MNIVRQLRIKKGIQQKELALELGVSSAAVSNWEKGKSDPSGDRLQKLAEIFGVEPTEIVKQPSFADSTKNLFIPQDPRISGKSETDQIIERILAQLDKMPKTVEARIVSGGMDKLPQEDREQILGVVRAMFSKNPELFEEDDANEPRL